MSLLGLPGGRRVGPRSTRRQSEKRPSRPLSEAVQEMRDHIDQVCQRDDIRIGSHSRGGSASKRARFIRIRPVKSAITYAIALHEIGHVLGPWQSQPRLYKEAGAWKWALDNAICWTPPMQKTMIRSLNSYLRWQKRRHRHVRLPEPEHEFWSLMKD